MRPLTEQETAVLFEKLSKFLGRSLRHLIERSDGDYCFRIHRDRVFYMSAAVLRQAQHASKDVILSAGTCFGKFTKTGKFRLHVTALDYLAQYSKNKVWVKPSSEMSFLYGNHVLKSGLGRITDSITKYQGVVIMSMSDIPLGFGVTAHGTQDCRKLEPSAIVAFHQGDTGEYLRQEADLL